MKNCFPITGYFGLMILLLTTNTVMSQFLPGDVFRDYTWTTPEKSGFEFLRVIGDGDYREPVNFAPVYPKDCIENGWIKFPGELDLKDAVKAEIQVEKLLSHDGTRGLAVKVNDSEWLNFPEPEKLPEPPFDYLYFNFPVVQVPLAFLKNTGNLLRFKVDSIQRFNMPQHILYGIHLRIYYSPVKNHAIAEIAGVENGDKIGETVEIKLKNSRGPAIRKVRYLGFYEDVNYEGDGEYLRWHYTFLRGEMRHLIGVAENPPFQAAWQTSWIPDQKQPFKIAALIEDQAGINYFTEPVENLQFERDYAVELCKPYNQPKMWATREQVFEENFDFPGEQQNVSEFQLVWSTWSPGYMNGVYLNDWLVFIKEGCHYCPGFHRITIDSNYMLKKGKNSIKTGLTPLVNGKMVHGAEILYPGIMVLVKHPK